MLVAAPGVRKRRWPARLTRDAAGTIQGVRYDELAPMLLNEVQKQQKTVMAQAEKIDAQDAKIRGLERVLAEMHAVLTRLQSRDQLVAQR